jgi:hypothetical protein
MCHRLNDSSKEGRFGFSDEKFHQKNKTNFNSKIVGVPFHLTHPRSKVTYEKH